jgi:hypothetical protein
LEATRTRRVGVILPEGRLDIAMAARGLEGRDLAKLAGVEADTIVSARNGRRISRRSLLLISDALLKVRPHPMAAILTGQTASEVVAAPTRRRPSKNGGPALLAPARTHLSA